MEDCTVSETSSKKTLYIDCDTPVTFEYIIEWEEQHPDIHVSPMSGEIKALSKTPIEILYRPSTNTTAQASFKLTTTEFNSKPCIVRVVGSAVPGTFNVGPRDNIEIEEYQHSDREDDEPDHLIRKDKPKTLLKNKTVGYQKRPGSGVKLKKIESVKLTARGLEAELKPDELQAEFANTLPTLKIKLTLDEQDFITVYRQLEELDKVKEIKFFRCLGDPPITEEDINWHKDKRQIYIDNLNMDRHDNTRYKTETDNDKVVVDTDLPMELKPQFDLYKNNHFELRKR